MSRADGKEVKNWSKYIGKRLIVVRDSYASTEIEVKVLEVSPSGKWVKFSFSSQYEGWEESHIYLLIEVLADNPDSPTRVPEVRRSGWMEG